MHFLWKTEMLKSHFYIEIEPCAEHIFWKSIFLGTKNAIGVIFYIFCYARFETFWNILLPEWCFEHQIWFSEKWNGRGAVHTINTDCLRIFAFNILKWVNIVFRSVKMIRSYANASSRLIFLQYKWNINNHAHFYPSTIRRNIYEFQPKHRSDNNYVGTTLSYKVAFFSKSCI